jgi:biopolymer transport protein ExbD
MQNSLVVSILVTVIAIIAVTGCVVILPESQNASHSETRKVESSGNVTVSVQALGEHQRYSVSQLVSYSAKQGYKLAVYDVNITNLNRARQAGNTTFFELTADNGTTYQAALNSLSPRVIGQGETLSGQVVFEIPQSAVPQALRYDDGNSKVTVGAENPG